MSWMKIPVRLNSGPGCRAGAFQPVWQPGSGLVYQAYESQGYQLRYLAEPYSLSSRSLASLQGRYDYPPVVEQEAEKTEPYPYTPWSTLAAA